MEVEIMHPERYAALAERTEDASVDGHPIRLDRGLQDFPSGRDIDELSALLRAAVRAREECRAEAYYCKFIPQPVSIKGHRSKDRVAVYVDETHSFILWGDEEVDQIVNKELARRVTSDKQPTLPPSEVGRVLANWIDQAISGPGQLPQGIHPAEWAAARFLDWWRKQVAQQLQATEGAVRSLRAAGRALEHLEAVEEAFANLRVSIIPMTGSGGSQAEPLYGLSCQQGRTGGGAEGEE